MIPVDFTRISLMVVTTISFSLFFAEMILRWKYYRWTQSNDGDIDEAGGNTDNYDDVHDDGVKS